jgi:hypothetical protein
MCYALLPCLLCVGMCFAMCKDVLLCVLSSAALCEDVLISVTMCDYVLL